MNLSFHLQRQWQRGGREHFPNPRVDIPVDPAHGKSLLGAMRPRASTCCPQYTTSEVPQRIGQPLADARGSDRSRDREGAVASEYATLP